MYDLPELFDATDRLWSAIGSALRALGQPAPARLTRGLDTHAFWLSPRLYFSQSCGYPLVTRFRDRLAVVGAFTYDVPGAEGATYASVLVCRPELVDRPLRELHLSRAAVNSLDSLSGWVSLVATVAGTGSGWAGTVRLTGSHAASLAEIAAGRADIASIDAVSFELFRRHRPLSTEHVVIVGHGPRVPTLPIVVAAGTPPDEIAAMRAAIAVVLADPAMTDTLALLAISGFEPLSFDDYASVARLAPAR
jgi:ABC-type phosphate/phosphonate transport system substrate-binding protein